MKSVIKKLAFALAVATMTFNLMSCAKEEKGSVYYLNFKPEVAPLWEEIAELYEDETGVEVKILTAASSTYTRALASELAKKDMPTLFQNNGQVGYIEWKKYCADIKDTDIYSWVLDKSLVISDGDGVYGIPYVVEGYGIIYNEEIMKKYFALPDKSVDISSTSEIRNYDILKKVVEDMTVNKDKLGIEGVFASTSFSSGEDWRWQTHLANLPIYHEFKDKNVSDLKELDLTYSENFKNIFDLYINNSCTETNNLGSKTVNDSMEEFALGKVAMVQNGNWAWSQISGIKGNVVAEDDIKFLPIYTGADGEEGLGICIGTENYFSVNSKASEADKKATIEFLEWLFSSETGKDFVTNRFGFITPFSTFEEEERPVDPLAKEVINYMAREDVEAVSWNFTVFPSLKFKEALGSSLFEYSKGEKDWESVMTEMKDDWKTQKNLE